MHVLRSAVAGLSACATLLAQAPAPTPPPIAKLVRDLGSPARRATAQQALAAGGKPAVDALMAVVRGENTVVDRGAALDALGRCKPAGGLVVRDLSQALGDLGAAMPKALEAMAELAPFAPGTSATVQNDLLSGIKTALRAGMEGGRMQQISTSLRRMVARAQVRPDHTIKQLIQTLQGTDSDQAEAAAEVLATRGEAAREALDALRQRLGGIAEHSKKPSRDILSRATLTIGAQHAKADFAHAHRARSATFTATERIASIRALGLMGASSSENVAVHALDRVLDDADLNVLREAITAVSMLGPAAKPLTGKLEKLAKHDDKQVRARAAAALRAVEK